MIRTSRLIITCIFFLLFILSTQAQEAFNKAVFYKAISSDDLEMVDDQLDLLNNSKFDNEEGYEGALLMKKAGLVLNPAEKLSLFKSGHKKLEEAIKNNSENVEFRFLRLIIQENAPGILNYNDDLEKDSILIGQKYKKLPDGIQKVILDYSKRSEFLALL
jgi:hypothetical protein